MTTTRRGRPPVDPTLRLVAKSVRLTADDWTKLEELGGVEWIRQALAHADVPPAAHAPRRRATKRAWRLAQLFVLDTP